jgi:hypothetical protein
MQGNKTFSAKGQSSENAENQLSGRQPQRAIF